MPDTIPQLGDKLTQLKNNFTGQLPARLQALHGFLERLRQQPDSDNPALAELHRAWHSLKGASRIFGFHDLAALATRAEVPVLPLLEQPDTPLLPDWLAQQQLFIDQLTHLTVPDSLQHGSQDTGFQAPFFEMSQIHQHWQEQGSPLIYICDDETQQVEFLGYQLRCFGYRVRHFTDVQSFEQAVMEQQPDAVVMDVHFPDGKIAGPETLNRVNQQLGYQLPSLVLSGMHHFEARLSAYRAGCHSYFIKPVKPLELADALNKLIRKPALDPYRILIIDDEPNVANYHSLILESAGMQVRQVNNPAHTLDVLREFLPDLILMDVYMPVCSGYELAGVIRQMPEYTRVSIIYLSSETDVQKQFNAMQVGVEGFITKPVVPDQLISAVTLRVERMRTLSGLMTRDGLTGLYNHTTTSEIISAILAQASRDSEPLVLAVLDLDLFKRVNDTYGHLAGDQVLLALAHMLKNRLRQGDIVGRYGGEEFVILLRNTQLPQAFELMDKLRNEFSQIQFSAGNDSFHCTFSVGLSPYTDYNSLDQLISHADTALYAAKNQGRNRVLSYGDTNES